MRKQRKFKFYYQKLPFLFTNGQQHFFYSLFGSLNYPISLKIDFFSNKLWQTLDEPKMFANLVRFERRYGITNKELGK